jgi:hypothetical protein
MNSIELTTGTAATLTPQIPTVCQSHSPLQRIHADNLWMHWLCWFWLFGIPFVFGLGQGPLTVLRAEDPPAILTPPRNQSVSVGATVVFRVTASGSQPLVMQWRHGEHDLPGATNLTLTLTNAQAANAGLYSVAVSNVAGSILSPPANLDVDTAFRIILSGPVVKEGGDSTGVSWADYDNDGDLDLFVSNFGTPRNFIYSNNGDGTFTRILDGDIARDIATSEGCAWADIDNDGDLDLFVAVGLGGNDLLYRNNGDGTFAKVTTGSIVTSRGSSRGCAWADYDRDGFVDLFVANERGENNFLFHNNGDGTFARITDGRIVKDGGNSTACAWGDYDNDGYPDLFVANNNENNFLYHNNRDGTFTRILSGRIVNDGGASFGCAWGDYDNDGGLDLFVANQNQRNFLYHNNNDGTFSRVDSGKIVTDVGYSWGCAWADYDNDGYLDLFVANGPPSGPGQNDFLYHNNGDGTFTKIASGSLVNDAAIGDGCAWGDYNNDGFLDLMVSNLNGQNNLLYENNGNSNAWIAVRCLGRVSNGAAIGARVELEAVIDGRRQLLIREISGGSGYGSQNSLIAHFGLGNAPRIETLRIRWPSGIQQEFSQPDLRRFHTFIEPARLAGLSRAPSGDMGLVLQGAVNGVYQIEASSNLKHWSPLLSVTNLNKVIQFRDPQAGEAQRFYRVVER